MTTFENIWRKLANKKYREEFAVSFLKRSVSFQIKTLRKKHCGSQAVLAERSNLTQGVVSRAEDQDYGNLTFNTVGRIAAGLDMAFVGKFVPFSGLVKFSLELSEDQFAAIPTFPQENALNTSVLGATVKEEHPKKTSRVFDITDYMTGREQRSTLQEMMKLMRKQPESEEQEAVKTLAAVGEG
jgi:transcriptional regulator with XRE-family HTH domain